jgi:acyl-CoA synthetase (AMP-forming)/AMP-acid ligase II
LRKSGVRCLLSVSGFLDIDYLSLLSRAAEPPQLSATVILRGQAPVGTHSLLDLHHLGEQVSALEAERRAAAVRPEDPSDLLFTSGTTGQPKGVLCSHAQTLRAFAAWSQRVGLCKEDRYLVAMPFFHSFGYKAGFLAAFMAGATVLPHAVFDVEAILSRIERDRVSVLPGPPALYQSLLCRPDLGERDLSSLRLAVTGAAMIPVDLVERMHRVLRFRTVLTGYGLTEATGVSTLCGKEDDAATVATTSGRAIPGVEVRVAGEDGKPLPPGEQGEVLIRGYTVMSGYWQDEGETAAVLNAEGFLHTGDIGVLDARGYLRITDRKKDIFIVGGFNAYPAEIENVMLEHPDVAQVAVVGVPDERLGEVGMAFVVLRAQAKPDAATLHEHCRQRLANFKVPRFFEFLPELPRNASGKVLKTELRVKQRQACEAR